jgi:CheY-like chemotaxis protein
MELVAILPSNLWPILADPGQIEQVLVNLVINARDAMPGGGTVCIDTANVAGEADPFGGAPSKESGHQVRLRVSDTGTGMAPDVVARVFEPFFTTKDIGIGTGLGLATVQGIVAQAEGTIEVCSELGVGTTFTMMFPVTAEAAMKVDELVADERAPNGETILVVEDQDALREVTERILTRYGYSVLVAASGPDAIDLVVRHEGPIDVLLTDVVMPGMLGGEVAERIHNLRTDIGVLYMSGYAQPVLSSQGRLDPGVALLDKPFSSSALLSHVAQVLSRKSDTR